MSIQFRDYSFGSGTGTATVTNNLTGLVDGDFLLASVVGDADGTQSAPAGWDLVEPVDHSTTALNGHLYSRVADSEPASWDFESGTTGVGVIVQAYYSDSAATLSIVDFNTGEANATSSPSGSVTSEDNSYLSIFWGVDSASVVNSLPTGMTEVFKSTFISGSINQYNEAIATGGSEVRTATIGLTDQTISIAAVIVETASGPTIDTEPSSVKREETGVILGASAGGFEASQGSGGVTYGGEACTVTAWSDTSITITIPAAIALKHDPTGYIFQVTTDGAETAGSSTIPFNEPDGWDYVDIDYTLVDVGSNDSVFFGDTPATLEDGQYVYENTTTPSGIAVTAISAEGYVTLASAPASTQTFDGYVIEGDGTVRETLTFTIVVTASGDTCMFPSPIGGIDKPIFNNPIQ